MHSVSENYKTVNVEEQTSRKDSVFYHYKRLIELRKKYDIITYGDYQLLLADHPRVFVYTRNWKNETLLVVSNFYAEEVTVELDLEEVEILISNYPDSQISLNKLKLRPYESVVYYKK